MAKINHYLHQTLVIAKKEWTLLLRNPHGLAVLFLMPAIFVLVMSFTLKNTLTTQIDMPKTGWLLENDSPQAKRWMQEWFDKYGGSSYTSRDTLRHAIASGDVQSGVLVLTTWLGPDGIPDSKQIEIWLNHKTQPAAAARLRAELTLSVMQVNLKMKLATAGPFAGMMAGQTDISKLLDTGNTPDIRYLYEIDSGRPMTAVQQTVPAWLIFGMFFVVIPIAGVLIQERNDRTLDRLRTFGVSHTVILGGKLFAFMILNWIQLAFMLIVGGVLLPLLGTEGLSLDISLPWFTGMTLAISAAAVSLALLIAAFTRTFDHAAALGSGINVILAAIAGVMVPRMLMPPGLQTISEWSPMGWALDGIQTVFLGVPETGFMLARIGLLLGFAMICLALSWVRLQRRS
ncbi:ABC transporter permease [Neopusillimonas aromaticivorans]|uniref:ABC transporter permease n=1 Tax=Neopusillimonas aromaticivorans TaxID=2979868 RepID=UPI002594F0BC|nr:ABC transporter permease [Neopusillimonas aromaticivorans]NLZ11255.1 ABC transporter permease [Alcaligenaceae bacterium]WJJ92874.1 ABC transporter permease [Neopusillimonas aromaticivorans]